MGWVGEDPLLGFGGEGHCGCVVDVVCMMVVLVVQTICIDSLARLLVA